MYHYDSAQLQSGKDFRQNNDIANVLYPFGRWKIDSSARMQLDILRQQIISINVDKNPTNPYIKQ
jgi:hypothetical protein